MTANSYLGLILAGLNTSLVPMYISEISPFNLRGGLGTINQLAVTVGLLVSQILGVEGLLGTDTGWPFLLGLAIFPPVFQLVLLPFCPESPRYLLITRQQEANARKANYMLLALLEQAKPALQHPASNAGVFWALFRKLRSQKTQTISLKLSTSEAR